jgi:hypothetical protein
MAGSDVTFSGAFSQFGKAILVLDGLQAFGSSSTPNYLDMEDALTTILDGEFTPDALPILRQAVRDGLASSLKKEKLRAIFRPFLRELCRAIGTPELLAGGQISDTAALRSIRQYMEDNAQLLKSRAMTFDVTATGTTTGTGAFSRLTVDKDANNLECTGAEVKTFRCVKDQNSGSQKHAEEFELEFADADASGLQWIGTGGVKPYTSLHARSGGLLVNPSFETGALTNNLALATTGQLTGWDVATAASWKTYSSAAYVYRGFPGQPSTLWGLECIASDSIIQVLKAENPGATFNPDTPYHLQIAWQRKASATGNLTIHLGGQSTTVAIGTGVNDAWNVLQLDLDSSRFYDNFKEDLLDIKIVVDTLAVGTVVIDDVVLAPMSNLDGTWWAGTGGATPWLKGDLRIFSGDTQGAATKLNYWLWRAYGDLVTDIRGWFPSTTTPSSIVITEPS